ncbi:MFS transporter [Streptomyces violarus]|uniref:DHA1 family inner membrane transport protein n=1 Tax=Streptomyces violarus TaxID=67380 RepID=A0A7W5F4U6_9ACTN|nr:MULTISPECIES: MFS transporter [Streptomyces]MBB3080160.1 DHA1 family inner membrane transport protein [Streptomyces violarus]WRU00610.1 MFS transporter [Streptomyces sp. CGMCC 4.1772]GHD14300.1 MFS transporter [Streptomyces violarus]
MSSPSSTKPDPSAAAPLTADGGTAVPAGKVKLPPVVWLLGAVAFLMGTSEFVISGLLPQISGALDVSVSSAGTLITAFAVGMMIGAPVMSMATQRLPRRSALIAALLVFAAGHVVGALSSSLGLALVGRFAAALGNGTFWAVGAVVATAAAGPAASTRAMGVMVGGITLANIVGVPLGTAAGQLGGWQAPFWMLAALAVAAAAVVARQLPADTTRADTSLRAEAAALKHPRLWLVYLAIALIQAGIMAAYSYVAPLLTDRAHLATAFVPLAMLGFGVGALAGTTVGGRLGDRRPYATLIPATALTSALLAAITLWATNSVVAVVLVVLLGGAGFANNPIVVGEVVRIAGADRSLPMALATSAFQVGIAAGSWLGGIALTSGLGLRGPSLAGFAFALAALLPLGLLAASHRKTEAARS